jgi:acyl dehydratase
MPIDPPHIPPAVASPSPPGRGRINEGNVEFGVHVGETLEFSKTVGESDIYLFAGITGDFFANHVNEEYMKKTPFGHRIAHGVLILAFAGTASSMVSTKSLEKSDRFAPVSLGYDRVRFLKPVFIGDTITIRYTIEKLEPERGRSIAKIEAINQDGSLVMVAEHIMKWVEKRG